MRKPGQHEGERGAALATVLVMVAVMSMVAIGVLDAARFSVQRTQNQTQMDQVRWYMLGAEAYAISRIDQVLAHGDSSLASLSGLLGQTITLPLDDGVMQVTVSDGANCFNLNSLVSQEEAGPAIASEAGQARFARLLSVIGISPARALAASAADWIDADNVPALGGAEDQAYGGSQGVYVPPNQLMGDVSEIRAINGFDAGIVGRLSRFVCARPTMAPNAISVNALRPEQAPLLSAIFGPGLPLVSAEAVIRARPVEGWKTLEAFFADPRLSVIQLSDESRGMFTLLSRWYVIGVRVNYADMVETSVVLVDTVSGHGRVVRRVFGASPTGSLL